jgi:hypothetical protein
VQLIPTIVRNDMITLFVVALLVQTRSVESESEGILGGVGVERNFGWIRSRKEFWVESESEGILGGVGVGFKCTRLRR